MRSKFINILLFLILFIILNYLISSNELKVIRIFKGEFKHNLYIIDCVDTNNNKLKLISFYNKIYENDSIKSIENLKVDLIINKLPQEFVYEEILPSFLPIYDIKYQHKTKLSIDKYEYFNSMDTFYYTNCLNGLTYIPKCNDSINLKKILNLGYQIDKNGIILNRIDSSVFNKNNNRKPLSVDSLKNYFNRINSNKIDNLKEK